MIEKKDIIVLLDNIADILEFRGENTFKINAYRMGAVAIRKLDADINEIILSKELNNIKGIGKGLQAIIYEYAEKGESSYLLEISTGVPAGVKDLMRIKGLGPKKIGYLYENLKISTIEDLENAVRENKLKELKGFGPAFQNNLLEEIAWVKTNSGYLLLDSALKLSDEIYNKLISFTSVKKVLLTGELKRRREIISLIEFLVEPKSKTGFLEELKRYVKYEVNDDTIAITDVYPVLIKIILININKTILTDFKLSCDKQFLLKLPDIEEKTYKSDEDIFLSINLPYIIPEMREKEYFQYNKPENSDLDVTDMKGLLHFHTTYSDGRNTLEEMISAAKQRNYEYAAVCDHSMSAYYANGLKEDRILLQHKEIERISKEFHLRILKGIESDILVDGSLDYNKDVLEKFEFIVASVHSRFNLSESEMTKRIIKAVENPYTDIIGHISGRLLLSREPYKFNIDKVLDACSRNGVAVEINSNPRRLDIDWRYAYKAREKGCIFSINADAHSIAELDLIQYGIMMGRKAGIKKNEVINCYNFENFVKFLNKKRNRIK